MSIVCLLETPSLVSAVAQFSFFIFFFPHLSEPSSIDFFIWAWELLYYTGENVAAHSDMGCSPSLSHFFLASYSFPFLLLERASRATLIWTPHLSFLSLSPPLLPTSPSSVFVLPPHRQQGQAAVWAVSIFFLLEAFLIFCPPEFLSLSPSLLDLIQPLSSLLPGPPGSLHSPLPLFPDCFIPLLFMMLTSNLKRVRHRQRQPDICMCFIIDRHAQ